MEILIGLTHCVTLIGLGEDLVLISMRLWWLLPLNTLLELPQIVHRGLSWHRRGKLKVFLLAHLFQVHGSGRVVFSLFAWQLWWL